MHLLLKYTLHFPAPANDIPLSAAPRIRGVPMVWELLKKLFKREFGSDLRAGVSMLTAIALREYLVATIVVLMLSGGEALEECARRKHPQYWMPWHGACPTWPIAKKRMDWPMRSWRTFASAMS